MDDLIQASPDLVPPLHAPILTAEEIAGIGEQARRRVRRWFARGGLLDADDIRKMLGWDGGGFSLDALVRFVGYDRAEPACLGEGGS